MLASAPPQSPFPALPPARIPLSPLPLPGPVLGRAQVYSDLQTFQRSKAARVPAPRAERPYVLFGESITKDNLGCSGGPHRSPIRGNSRSGVAMRTAHATRFPAILLSSDLYQPCSPDMLPDTLLPDLFLSRNDFDTRSLRARPFLSRRPERAHHRRQPRYVLQLTLDACCEP